MKCHVLYVCIVFQLGKLPVSRQNTYILKTSVPMDGPPKSLKETYTNSNFNSKGVQELFKEILVFEPYKCRFLKVPVQPVPFPSASRNFRRCSSFLVTSGGFRAFGAPSKLWEI